MGFDYTFNTHKLGRDDNRWYGKVVDAKHWKPQNDLFMITGLPNARVKVRIIGADRKHHRDGGRRYPLGFGVTTTWSWWW